MSSGVSVLREFDPSHIPSVFIKFTLDPDALPNLSNFLKIPSTEGTSLTINCASSAKAESL